VHRWIAWGHRAVRLRSVFVHEKRQAGRGTCALTGKFDHAQHLPLLALTARPQSIATTPIISPLPSTHLFPRRASSITLLWRRSPPGRQVFSCTHLAPPGRRCPPHSFLRERLVAAVRLVFLWRERKTVTLFTLYAVSSRTQKRVIPPSTQLMRPELHRRMPIVPRLSSIVGDVPYVTRPR